MKSREPFVRMGSLIDDRRAEFPYVRNGQCSPVVLSDAVMSEGSFRRNEESIHRIDGRAMSESKAIRGVRSEVSI